MECPKCARQMTNTTPTKGYCMKCDVLVHLPSGVVNTGDPKEDKFIGSTGISIGQKNRSIEATLSSDALILTWKEGKAFAQEKIPYASIAVIDTGKRRETELVWTSPDSVVAAVLGGGALALTSHLVHFETLKLSTKGGDYEIFVAQAKDWADRLRRKLDTGLKFCRECGAKIPRDSMFCEECGTRLAQSAK